MTARTEPIWTVSAVSAVNATQAARPPFGVVEGLSPAEVAAEIAIVCDAVAARPDKLQWVERETTRRFEGLLDPAMTASARASRAIAQAIDADAPNSDRHPYHCRQHFCEVMLVACFLGQLHRLPHREAQRLLLAALIHDIDHDGRPGGDFRAERASVVYAAPYLARAGVDTDETRRIAALVLATDPAGRRLALRAATGGRAGPVPAVAPEVAALRDDPSLARLAVLLCEADLLPSIGLTPAHGQRLQRQLAREWQRPLGAEDKRRFLAGVLADGVVGYFFRPNVVAFHTQLSVADDGTADC